MATPKRNNTPPKDFQDAIRELEQILQEIERGEIGLEESLLKYERGNLLIQHCQGILNTAEKQIEQITKAPDGAMKISPLSDGENIPEANPLPILREKMVD
jgi:exodeoxyribonuclease VII small subunit